MILLLIKNDLTCIEIINKKTKDIIVNVIYRPPNGKIKPFKSYLKSVILKNGKTGKPIYSIGDFNLNVLDYETNSKVKNFFNMIFQYGLMPNSSHK